MSQFYDDWAQVLLENGREYYVRGQYPDGRYEKIQTPMVSVSELFIHLGMTDGDGREPLGIKNNGTDILGIVATFRQSADPVSPVIEAITGLSWRVTIRNEAGRIYDIVDVAFVNGVASFNYTTTGNPDICSIRESDFDQIELGGTTYVLKLVGDSTFKVYRQL
jgi:hypothetical protein